MKKILLSLGLLVSSLSFTQVIDVSSFDDGFRIYTELSDYEEIYDSIFVERNSPKKLTFNYLFPDGGAYIYRIDLSDSLITIIHGDEIINGKSDKIKLNSFSETEKQIRFSYNSTLDFGNLDIIYNKIQREYEPRFVMIFKDDEKNKMVVLFSPLNTRLEDSYFEVRNFTKIIK